MDTIWIVATILSLVIFFILSSIDDQRAKKKGSPSQGSSRKVALFFFITIVVFTGTFLLSGTNSGRQIMHRVRGGGETLMEQQLPKVNEIHMLKNIREDIHVGSGPFFPQSQYN